MRALVALLLGLLVACHPVHVADTPRPEKADINMMRLRAVKITALCISKTGEFYSSTGSGSIVKSNAGGSTVLTAKHVVDDPTCSISAEDYFGDRWIAHRIRVHEKADIAVFDIYGSYGLPTLRIGKPRYDQELITLGFPYDLLVKRVVYTITRGTVVSLYKNETFFRMTAPVLPGASGSAVYDRKTGALVGVVSMMLPLEGHWRAAREGHYYAEYADYVFDLLPQPEQPKP